MKPYSLLLALFVFWSGAGAHAAEPAPAPTPSYAVHVSGAVTAPRDFEVAALK